MHVSDRKKGREMRKTFSSIIVASAMVMTMFATNASALTLWGSANTNYGPGIGELNVSVLRAINATDYAHSAGWAYIFSNSPTKRCIYGISLTENGVVKAWNYADFCETDKSTIRNTIYDSDGVSDGTYFHDCSSNYQTVLTFQIWWADGATTGVLTKKSDVVNGANLGGC